MGTTDHKLEVRLLGMPRLLLNGQDVEGLRRKNLALIYYLAAQDGPTAREKLLSFFWPDHERAEAQPILRTMIHDLHRHLGESFHADDRSVALSAGANIDARAFSDVFRSKAPELQPFKTALELYRGDFLEGFSLPDSPQFDDWAASEQERYRLMAMKGFAGLADLYERQRDYPAALETMRRALAFDPFQEDLQRSVMRLLYRNGERAGVVRQYEALCKLLDEELGVPPMPETRTLYDAIINDTFAPLPAEAAQPTVPPIDLGVEKSLLPFLGRDLELDLLQGQLDAGKLILLVGEPGIGKTRLVTELIHAQTRGRAAALVLQGNSYELEQGLPYHSIVDALRKILARPDWESLFVRLNLEPVWLSELSRLLPDLLTRFPHLPAPAAPADEPRLWEALLRFFQGLSRQGEVWLFLDDLHWADQATIAWLGYLVRNLSARSFNVLATSRPLEGQTHLIRLVQALTRENRLVQMPLSVLPETAMQEMALALSQQHTERFSGWLIENAEGNPFFLTELVRYAYGIGLLKKDGAMDMELLSQSPAIPATIQNLVESRLLKLSEPARRILHTAAIIGREFDFELVRQVSSIPEVDTLDAVDELQAAHLINPLPGSQFAFDHSLTMQVALNDMSETRRRLLHRRLAETLEGLYQKNLDPVSGLIAQHFLGGGLPERAKAYAFRAGQFSANLAAWAEAIAFYEQALALEPVPAERVPILLEMGRAHFHKGDFPLASKDYQLAVELARASRKWSLLEDAYIGLGLSFYPQARFAEAVAAARELRESGPPEMAACAEFLWGASLVVESAHPVEAERHLREAWLQLQEQPLPFASQVTPLQIQYSLAGAFGQQGRSREAVEQFREVLGRLERGEGTLDTLRNIMLLNNLAYHLHLLGDPSAGEYIQKGIRLAQERGSLSHLPYLYSTSGEIALARGDLDAAEKNFRDGLVLARQIPIPERVAGMSANLGLVARARGDLQLAREWLQTALSLVGPLGNHHLEVRIRIALAPLLPGEDALTCLDAACALAEQGGLDGLAEEVSRLKRNIA
jgi:DNA-binding SARP family transcriptional activator